jgi:E3 ubiquitin-protein ligase HUWE1
LLKFLIPVEEQEQEGNRRFRSLITLHIRIALLSDVFSTAGYTHGRAAIGILQTLMGDSSVDVVPDLGTLHRACIWENILLKAGLTSKGIDSATSPDASPLERSPSRTSAPLTENDPSITTNGVQPEASNMEESSSVPKAELANPEGPREHNAKALKHLTHGLPSSLAPFFQGKSNDTWIGDLVFD